MRLLLTLIIPFSILAGSIVNYILDYTNAFYILFASLVVYYALLILFLYLFSKKFLNTLNKECDPEKFMRYNQKIRKFYTAATRDTIFKLDKAVGLRNLGRFDEALLCLRSINFNDRGNAIMKNLIILFHNNLTDLYILKNDLNAAQENAFYGKQILDTATQNKKQTKQLRNSLYLNQYTINMLNGNIENFENFFVNNFERSKNTYSKIDCGFVLAKFYYMNKQYDKAKPLFEFIIANGNKLFHVKMAQEYLDKILNN